jgi:hypothetical protein
VQGLLYFLFYMLSTPRTNRCFSWLLLGGLMLSSLVRGVHAVVSHHPPDHEHPVCAVGHDGPQQHLHDNHCDPHHCELCVFHFSTALPALPTGLSIHPPVPFSASRFGYADPVSDNRVSGPSGRGPPVLV